MLYGLYHPLGLNASGCLIRNLLSAGQLCGRRAGRTHSRTNDQLATNDCVLTEWREWLAFLEVKTVTWVRATKPRVLPGMYSAA